MADKNKLIVASLELDVCYADKLKNLAAVRRMLESLDEKCHIIVLPEMFATGFTFEEDLAEDEDGLIVNAIKTLAEERQVAICGTFLAKEGDKLYNRCFFVTPQRDYYKYDKRHLFSLGHEDDYLSAGDRTCVISYAGWNIAMFVCYDLRFPKWMRNVNNSYDLIILPASWPSKRDYAWRHLQIARAIENEAYLISCNRRGIDHKGVEHIGNSMALDYAGNPIGNMQLKGVLVSELDKDKLSIFRDKYRFWQDAD